MTWDVMTMIGTVAFAISGAIVAMEEDYDILGVYILGLITAFGGGEKDFGKEAIDTLVKHMEDKQHDFVLILAGYSREMDHFLSLNPGLKSRFPVVLDFPDYSVDQLMEIARRMLSDKEYHFAKEAEWELKNHLRDLLVQQPRSFSNGRYVRNVIEKTIRQQAMRLLLNESYDRQELMMIQRDDLDFGIEK